MLPQMHFIFGTIFIILLYFFFSPIISIFGLAIIFLSSVLIDIDHYAYYALRKKDWNLFNAYKWYKNNVKKLHSLPKEQRKTTYFGFCVFHGVEILIILFLLGIFLSPIFSLIFIGSIFHLSLDLASEIILEQRIDKISFIYDFLTFRKLIHIEDFKDLN